MASSTQISLTRSIGIFSILALIALFASSAVLYFSAREHRMEAALENVRLNAEATAHSVNQIVRLMNTSLDAMAQDPWAQSALSSGNAEVLKSEEERLTALFPGAMLMRLLPPGAKIMDEERSPRMGYADLEMANQAVSEMPKPFAHAANTPDVHIAMARELQGEKGILLVSLTDKLLQDAAPPTLQDGALEIRQENLSLVFRGNAELKGKKPDGETLIPGTPWKVVYWAPNQVLVLNTWFLSVPFGLGVLIVFDAWLSLRRLKSALLHDQEICIQVANKIVENQPIDLGAMRMEESESLLQGILRLRIALRAQLGQEEPVMLPSIQVETIEHDGIFEFKPESKVTTMNKAPEPIPSTVIDPHIFRAYDIRGVVGTSLTTDLMHELGRAIGSEAQARGEARIALARDGRISSPELSRALARGLQASGRQVIDLGQGPTPLLYFATHVLNTKSGVMITGSHNPAQYNGLKIVLAGETLAEEGIQKLRKRIEARDYFLGQGQIEQRDLTPDYVERILDDMHLGRPMKVVVDCGNGVAGDIVPDLLRRMDCEVVELFCEVDGRFPNHHPDPSKPENLATLIQTVRDEKADLGVAFDGDADRLGVVDSNGKIIWPDRQLMVFAADVLSREPGADIIYDVKCSRHLAGQIVRNGGRPLMWKTGHSLIKAKMKEIGAALAGEMSGHIFFNDRWFGFDDGIYASARMIEILSGDPRSTAEVFEEVPDSLCTPELNISLAEGESFRFVEALLLRAQFPDARITDIDGLRVDFVDGWGLVRASNTTPSLVLRFEADDAAAMKRIQEEFRGLMLGISPDLKLPF